MWASATPVLALKKGDKVLNRGWVLAHDPEISPRKLTAHFIFEKMELHDGLDSLRTKKQFPGQCFVSPASPITAPGSMHRQMTMRILATAFSAQRLVYDEGSPNAGGLASAHSPCYLFRVLQMRNMPQADSRR